DHRHRQSFGLELARQPHADRRGLDADSHDVGHVRADGDADRLGLAERGGFEHLAAGPIDDAHARRLQRNVQSYVQVHDLSLLVLRGIPPTQSLPALAFIVAVSALPPDYESPPLPRLGARTPSSATCALPPSGALKKGERRNSATPRKRVGLARSGR